MEDIKKGAFMLTLIALYIGTALLVAWLSISLLIDGLSYAEAKRATVECKNWQDQAEVIKGFYLTTAERSQCEYYNINVNTQNES